MKNYIIKVQIFIILTNFICLEAKVSDQRQCADPNCSVLLGVGKTVLKYFAKDDGMLSFASNKPVKIFSKGAGSNPDLWGVMIDGRRGYVNKAHVQEQRVYRKDLEFMVPTEFYATLEGSAEDEKVEDKKLEEENIPFNADIEKTTASEHQIETKQPTVEIQATEVVSSFSAAVESQSADNSAISTPPIDSSIPPTPQQSSAAPQPVQPNSSIDYEVVDGTTIYFDDPPPKINEAPSMENSTPEAISPTMTEARAKPTESSKVPEIESSVSDNLHVVDKIGTAVLSDNPGGSASTVSEKDAIHENVDSTEPVTDDIRTASYDLGSKEHEINHHPKDIAEKIQVDKPVAENTIPFTASADIEEDNEDDYEEEDDESNEERDEIENGDEELDDEYIDEMSNEEKLKLQKKIEEMKMQPVGEQETHSEETRSIDSFDTIDTMNNDMLNSEHQTEEEKEIPENIPYTVSTEPEILPNTQTPDSKLQLDTVDAIELPEINIKNTDADRISIDAVEINNNEVNIENESYKISKQETVDFTVEQKLDHGADQNNQGHSHEHIESAEHGKQKTTEQSHDHSHGHSHEHQEYDNLGHGHSHDHQGHGHGHDHQGHGHSHDHHDHDHSHGIGHLGQGVKQHIPETIPEYYKPAQQKFDLPLSAQFGSPSPYIEPSKHTTMPPIVEPYEHGDAQITENVSEAVVKADLMDTTINSPDININEQQAFKDNSVVETTIFSEEIIEKPVSQTIDTLDSDPSDEVNVESYTPASETTLSPDVNNEVMLSPDALVETNQFENTLTVDIAADSHQLEATDALIADDYKPEAAVEESGGLFASIASFFSSGPDKALLDAINTPPDMVVKGKESEILNDDFEKQTNENILQTNTKDNNNNDYTQEPITNEQLTGDGDNGMANVNVLNEEIEVEPKGKELYATFSDEENIVVNESSEHIEIIEEPIEINSADDLISENDLQGQEAQSSEINEEISKDEHVASLDLPVDENTTDPPQDPQQDDIKQIFIEHMEKETIYNTQAESYVPEWLTVIAHDQGFINSDRLALVGIIAITLLFLHLINTFMDRSTREKPLIRKVAEMDRKLFAASNELLILKKEMSDNGGSAVDSGASVHALREMELQLEQTRLELVTSRETVKKEGDRSNLTLNHLEMSKHEVIAAREEAKQAQEMVEEMLASQQNATGKTDDKLLEVVQQLQSQLESQKDMLLKYEPKLKKKEKENKELSKQLKQMRADVANANLETEKIKKELSETLKIKDDSTGKLAEIEKNEQEWKSLTDLLQSQLDEKNEAFANMETDMSSLRSRISIFKNESESKEEQLEILQETLDELQTRKSNKDENNKSEEADGWEVEEDSWGVDEVNEIKEVAKLRIENRKNSELKEELEKEVIDIKSQLETASVDLDNYKTESTSLREARDEVLKENSDVQRRLDVLTEFFNKKEAELQKQLGLQSARFGDVSTDAESTARQLISVTSELESTQGQLKIIKGELEDQERSLKASVAGQEKKAHENWVAARQAERKLTELQGEMSLLRNKLTMVESKNTLLDQEKEDLAGTVNMLRTSVKSEPVATNGMHGSGSLDSLSLGQAGSGPNSVTGSAFPTGPESLPPLPGLPGISNLGSALPNTMPGMTGMPFLPNPLGMVPPLFQPGSMLPGIPPMLEMRQPPLGRMSPGPRDRSNRSFSSRSPSPEYERYRGGSGRNGNRDMSPSSRSERRTSPVRRGPSPTRSERAYRDRQYQPDYSRDRYYNRGSRDSRDMSPDRYSTRSEQSERESPKDPHRYRDDLKRTGPKTSTPTGTQARTYRA